MNFFVSYLYHFTLTQLLGSPWFIDAVCEFAAVVLMSHEAKSSCRNILDSVFFQTIDVATVAPKWCYSSRGSVGVASVSDGDGEKGSRSLCKLNLPASVTSTAAEKSRSLVSSSYSLYWTTAIVWWLADVIVDGMEPVAAAWPRERGPRPLTSTRRHRSSAFIQLPVLQLQNLRL